jgi:hypothetical protein
MNVKKLFVLAVVMGVTMSQLSAMPTAVVLENCPYKRLIGRVASVVGTVQEIFRIDDIWKTPKALKIPPINIYMSTTLYNPLYGTVYYVSIDGLGYCLHNSWLKKIDDEDVKE